jgi:hypothetical protein
MQLDDQWRLQDREFVGWERVLCYGNDLEEESVAGIITEMMSSALP